MGKVNILFISSVILWFQFNIKPTLRQSEQKTKEMYCCINTIYSSRTRQQKLPLTLQIGGGIQDVLTGINQPYF